MMTGKIIHAGEEVLMAYHGDYWRRWRPADVRPRGRPRKQRVNDDGDEKEGAGDGGGHSADDAQRGCSEQRATVYAEERGGVRIGEGADTRAYQEGGRGRGRPRGEDGGNGTTARKRKRYSENTWGTVARDEYQRAQQSHSGDRFERGEGGGVT